MTRIPLPNLKRAALIVLIINAAYWLIMPWPMPDWIVMMMQALRAALSAMVVAIFGAALWEYRKEPLGDNTQIFVLGIFILFSYSVYVAMFSIAYRLAGRPIEWSVSPFATFEPLGVSLAAICFLAVPGAIEGRIPKRNVVLMSIALALAALVAGIIIGMQITDQV